MEIYKMQNEDKRIIKFHGRQANMFDDIITFQEDLFCE